MALDHCAMIVIRWMCVGMLSILNANSGLPQLAAKSHSNKKPLVEFMLGELLILSSTTKFPVPI